MNILLVAATPYEIAPMLTRLEQNFQHSGEHLFEENGVRIRVLITGVGSVATAWRLGQYFAFERPDWVINAGVAGAFDRSLPLGTVVSVKSDCFGDLGIEEADGRFVDLFELGLSAPSENPFINGKLYNPVAEQVSFLPAVKGLTVNRVHGNAASIKAIKNKYPDVQIETMEGAAFFYGCLLADLPFLAVRSISNYVEPRNREAWELDKSIEKLNAVLIEMLESITLPAP